MSRRSGLVLCACAAAVLGCKDKTPPQPATPGSGFATVAESGSARPADASSESAASIDSGSDVEASHPSDTDASIAAAGSDAGSAEPDAGTVAVTVDAGLASDELDYDNKSAPIELRIAFANRVPKLPAVSADGTWIADYGSDAAAPTRPSPIFVRVVRVDGKGTPERLELVDDDMVQANRDAGDWEVNPPPPPVEKVLRERAARVVARLGGFASLSSVDTRGTTTRSGKVGAFKLASTEKPGSLLLALTDARGKAVQREQIDSYSDGTHPPALEGGACEFRPTFHGAYLDRAKRHLYVTVAFRWREECSAPDPRFVAWELPPQT